MTDQNSLQLLFESCQYVYTAFGPPPQRDIVGELGPTNDERYILKNPDGLYSEHTQSEVGEWELSAVDFTFNHIRAHILSNGNQPNQWRIALGSSENPQVPIRDASRFISKKLPTADDANNVHVRLINELGCISEDGDDVSAGSHYVYAWRQRIQ